MKERDSWLPYAGIFLLLYGLLAVFNSFYLENPYQVLWICYAALIIIGIGFLKRNPEIIASQVNILAIPILFWNLDFLSNLLLQRPLWGITDYFFQPGFNNISRIISLQHLFLVPLALYALYKLKISRKSHWKVSFLQIALFFIIGFFIFPRSANINCVTDPCFYFPSNLDVPYQIIWFAIFLSLTFLTSYLLNSLNIFKNSKKT